MSKRLSGFTLVELAIVLVIIGLLSGGVLTGQELIKQAKVRSTLTQLREYGTALNTFKSKYGATAIPGDFQRAHAFGIDAATQGGSPNVAETGCTNNDGNGDGQVGGGITCNVGAVSNSQLGENVNFWVHLSNAGLIKGGFSQPFGCWTTPACNYTPDSGLPGTPVGLVIGTLTDYAASSSFYFIVGVDFTVEEFGGLSYLADNADMPGLLTTEEAFAIDTKLDNGKPDTGTTQYFMIWNGFFKLPTDFSMPIDSGCYSGAGGDYVLTNTAQACRLRIKAN